MTKERSKAETGQAPAFTKEQILQASRFSKHVDIIDALLESDRQYTIKEVEDTVDKFLKGKVK